MCYWFVLDLFIPRVQSILNTARESVGHGETQAPDCSSITDARNNESLFLLVKELNSNLDLKFKMPDDQARQVRDAFSLVLFCFKFHLFFALKFLFRTSKVLIFKRWLDTTCPKKESKCFLILLEKGRVCHSA